ncbi:transposase [Streptomyces sp. NPDC057910]|uniref:IS66 family transposase n=1 Tax=Streptomyces sp. NPDC057910 TaxID=3346278 RepID=UPI0036EDACFD
MRDTPGSAATAPWIAVRERATSSSRYACARLTPNSEHLGIDQETGAFQPGRRLVLSSDLYTAYQSLSRIDGVDPLWCWAHIRRYFLRAGDAHAVLATWRDEWTEKIAVLYVTHRADPGGQAGHAVTVLEGGADDGP